MENGFVLFTIAHRITGWRKIKEAANEDESKALNAAGLLKIFCEAAFVFFNSANSEKSFNLFATIAQQGMAAPGLFSATERTKVARAEYEEKFYAEFIDYAKDQTNISEFLVKIIFHKLNDQILQSNRYGIMTLLNNFISENNTFQNDTNYIHKIFKSNKADLSILNNSIVNLSEEQIFHLKQLILTEGVNEARVSMKVDGDHRFSEHNKSISGDGKANGENSQISSSAMPTMQIDLPQDLSSQSIDNFDNKESTPPLPVRSDILDNSPNENQENTKNASSVSSSSAHIVSSSKDLSQSINNPDNKESPLAVNSTIKFNGLLGEIKNIDSNPSKGHCAMGEDPTQGNSKSKFHKWSLDDHLTIDQLYQIARDDNRKK
ncbi:MAG: hypothetical protein LBI69_02910 [Puniceicoccales bacterium]|jgi:hypothetical protein|nr:hypothetical protein [Puniceicoccales bacterium]